MIVKVFDGFVLAADSATTFASPKPDGSTEVENIYNNANKIFNLRKGLPIAAMTWGLGNIGPASIATLSKDLRKRFAGDDPAHHDWHLDPASYTMAQVVDRAVEYFHAERYAPMIEAIKATGQELPDHALDLGLLVAGYSADADEPQAFEIVLSADGTPEPSEIIVHDTGAQWWGQPEAITRLLLGISQGMPQALLNLGVPPPNVQGYTQAIVDQVRVQMVSPAMPIQDAIDLAEFLVETTIKFVRFSPGHPTVAGPIEVAAVTKHEQFKWVSRKHYYSHRLNPSGTSQDTRLDARREGM